jgi:hypothetical protein
VIDFDGDDPREEEYDGRAFDHAAEREADRRHEAEQDRDDERRYTGVPMLGGPPWRDS